MVPMASISAIDTADAGSGLSAAGETSAVAVMAGMPATPTGTYGAPQTAMLTGILAGRLATLGVKVETGVTAAATSVAMYDGAEETNQTSLST
jgi:hypothetical protein